MILGQIGLRNEETKEMKYLVYYYIAYIFFFSSSSESNMNFTICSSYTPLFEHGGDLVKDLTGKCKFINYLRNCLPLFLHAIFFFFESILLHAIEIELCHITNSSEKKNS